MAITNKTVRRNYHQWTREDVIIYPVCWLYHKEPESISHIDSGCYTLASTELHTMTESSCPHSSLFYFESKWVCHWEAVALTFTISLRTREIKEPLARIHKKQTHIWWELPTPNLMDMKSHRAALCSEDNRYEQRYIILMTGLQCNENRSTICIL